MAIINISLIIIGIVCIGIGLNWWCAFGIFALAMYSRADK